MPTEEYLKQDLANPLYLDQWQDIDWKVWLTVNRPVFQHPEFKDKVLRNL